MSLGGINAAFFIPSFGGVDSTKSKTGGHKTKYVETGNVKTTSSRCAPESLREKQSVEYLVFAF